MTPNSIFLSLLYTIVSAYTLVSNLIHIIHFTYIDIPYFCNQFQSNFKLYFDTCLYFSGSIGLRGASPRVVLFYPDGFVINFLSGLLLCKTLVEMYPSLAQHHSHKLFFVNRPKRKRFVLPASPHPPSIIPEKILIIKNA